jgi:hypothetical protein
VGIIAKVDSEVLNKMMDLKTGILPALKTKNTSSLERECEALFGDRARQGKLAEIYKFDYGETRTAPPELGPIPEKPTKQD